MMKTISLKLPRTLDAKLSAVAKRQGATKSAIVREALESYLNGDRTRFQPSFAELAKDFIGCVEGAPPDLSYNKKYLKGFGK